MIKRFCIGLLTAASLQLHVYAETIKFGVVPQQAPSILAKRWLPMINHMREHTGLDIRFVTAKNIPEFEKRLSQGEFDVAYMNPFHYTVFSEMGYRAIVKRDNQPIKGIIVTRKNSGITEISQVDNAQLAFPAPAAFAATLLPKAELRQQGINFDSKYVSSHDSVYLGVSRGFFVAGGGVKRTFNNMPKQIRDNLTILWETNAYPPHAFAVNDSLSLENVSKIKEALISLNDTEAGQSIIKKLGMRTLTYAKNGDWDDVRALNINVENVSLDVSLPTQ